MNTSTAVLNFCLSVEFKVKCCKGSLLTVESPL